MIERDELERLFREANRQAESHQYEAAISVYREVITLAGDDDLLAAECAHWGIGEVSLTLGDYSLALESIESALFLNPWEAAYHFHLGVVYTRLGSRAKALAAMERAWEIEPLKPKVVRGFGWTLHRFGETDRGIKMMLAALSLKPDDPHTLRSLGWMFACETRYREAMVCLEKSLELDPCDLRTISAVSTVARLTGDPDPPHPIPATGPNIFAVEDDWDDEGGLLDEDEEEGLIEEGLIEERLIEEKLSGEHREETGEEWGVYPGEVESEVDWDDFDDDLI